MADLILTNGRFFTLWSERPRVSAIAVRGGRIVAAGDEAEIQGLRGARTPMIDLRGRTVIPGLTDSHVHLMLYGRYALMWADLGGSRSIAEMLNRLRDHAFSSALEGGGWEEGEDGVDSFHPHPSPLPCRAREEGPSEWILGRGFDQEILAERRFPTREDLDEVSRDRPILISRLCGHACVVNSRAIELAGPERLPEAGRESGLLTEGDMDPVWEQMPGASFEQLVEAGTFAAAKARSTGITAVHCLINSMDELNALRHLHASGRLPVRFYVQVSYSMFPELTKEGLKTGSGDDMLRIGSVKMFADGSMGARTAALSEDFADDPGNRGILLHTDEELTDMVRNVHGAGRQAAIHAIGDRAVEQAVNAIETVLAETGEDNSARRHRVEHASILSEKLVERMARLKILAAVQPQFIVTDFWTIDRVGPERYRWAYPFRTLMESGVPMSLGSDCPVERLDAFELICRAVTRDEYSPDECLTVEDAVRLYALGGAHAAFEEANRGSIEPGKLADMVVLDRDIFNIPASEIAECRAELVLVGGTLSRASAA